ncbi:hypothetical protein CWB41_02570 [Methylovirgula ligni]|uniref:Uncharacterized protein n=1 Tax=Methylovirgula ligni TaxID=569860 RepID=A0A3D9YXH3_9HYPH|nr:hypothetical protein [Methylovirgula ligni]QAY94761.1 hypothetical protein CWB41_02570 [Methylovirgula ligni]REF87341.1 hypothetical protein DES32_0961 [Methylovirgula ligni]
MADYYPLLAKAVAGLPNSTPETRRAVYERARKALLGQLQSLQPPVPEADLRRESEALDAAVARIESELSGGAQPVQPQPQPQRPVTAKPAVPPRPAPPLRQPVSPQAPAQPATPRRPNGATVLGDEPPAPPSARGQNGPTPVTPNPASEPPPTAPQQPVPPREPRVEPPRARPSAAARPAAPQPDLEDAPQNHRLWIVVGVVVVLVALVAVAAWKLRDRPDQFAAFKPHPQTTADANDKSTQRADGSAPATPTVADTTAPTPAVPAPAAESAPAAAAKPADANNPVPVAYRAALLVEAPDEPNKIKTYVGTVIWKTENVSNGPGQPLASAVHGDIDVPDDKLKATIDIQKNNDPSLSASHTITVVFSIVPDSPTGGVKEISLPQLRNEDSPSGEALKGIVVPIMDNSFLVGLTRGDAEAHNADLLKKLEWIDIPIMLNNGRIAKLTFEKNTSGTRAINDAFASWQTPQ